MVYWEGHDADFNRLVEIEFAEIWRSATKIVFSHSLTSTSSSRTSIEPEFNAESILRLKETLSRAIAIGGAELASHALSAGLVDEVNLFLVPIVVGAGKPAFPNDDQVALELMEERRFANGQVLVRYAVAK
jgi:dihydrofolate reductase